MDKGPEGRAARSADGNGSPPACSPVLRRHRTAATSLGIAPPSEGLFTAGSETYTALPALEPAVRFNISVSSMFKNFTLAMVVAVFMAPLSLEAATSVFKCTINGSVSYQNDPCPSGSPRKLPNVDQLNAERQKAPPQAGDRGDAPWPSAASVKSLASNPNGAARAPVPSDAGGVNSFKCDGRVYCSQMTSCAEAKYFLSHCPGVKMDGDRDGTPCEKQWCGR
jgi:hypothetical protein